MEKTITACAICHRAVWSTDVDAQGVCVLCAPPAAPRPARPAPSAPKADPEASA
jgi:hypothetical protein